MRLTYIYLQRSKMKYKLSSLVASQVYIQYAPQSPNPLVAKRVSIQHSTTFVTDGRWVGASRG